MKHFHSNSDTLINNKKVLIIIITASVKQFSNLIIYLHQLPIMLNIHFRLRHLKTISQIH